MPNTQDTNTTLQPDGAMGANAQQVQANPNDQKGQPTKPKQQSINPEEIQLLIQAGMEQVKFELKQELTQAINAKAQQLSDMDPTTATAMRAIAGAMNEAVSSVTPLGGNEEFNAQQGQQIQQDASQQQVKQSSDELAELIWNTMVTGLEEKGYFEKNASFEKEMVNDDLTNTYVTIGKGVEKFADDNEVDFTDSNYHDLLKELILDGTFYDMGVEEND
jgi:hypothetical protein